VLYGKAVRIPRAFKSAGDSGLKLQDLSPHALLFSKHGITLLKLVGGRGKLRENEKNSTEINIFKINFY
jgi:hypothetical protein